MTEILFGESEAASMKCAKGSGGIIGPMAVTGHASHTPPVKKKWSGVPGSPDEVLCLGYMLDIGSLQYPAESPQRKHILLQMQGIRTDESKKPQNPDDEEMPEALQNLQKYDRDYAKLKEIAAGGGAVRIWYSSRAPYSYCGLCWLCHELARTKAELYVIDLPEYEVHADYIVHHKSWGEIECERFSTYLDRQKKLTCLEKRMYESEWMEAAASGSVLRAVVNGTLMGVPEEFYDFLILNRLTRQPEKEARIIGDILGKSQSGVGDWWYAYRIEKLIESGMIGIAEDSGKEYARVIYKCV